MADKDEAVIIRCFDNCVYKLAFPMFFLNAPKATLRKIFKWLFQFDGYRENQDAIEFFDRKMPALSGTIEVYGKARIAAAEKAWKVRLTDYEYNFLDPDPSKFPADWTKEKKRTEQAARKAWNTPYARLVKNAEKNVSRTKKQVQKELDRAKAVYEIYLAAKGRNL